MNSDPKKSSRKEKSNIELITIAVGSLIVLGACYITDRPGFYQFLSRIPMMLIWMFICTAPLLAIQRWRYYRLRRKTKIEVTPENLILQLGNEITQVRWSEILTARKQIEGQADDFIELVTTELIIPVEPAWFNLAAVWPMLAAHLSAEALQGRDYKELPFYQRIVAEQQRWLNEQLTPVSVGYSWQCKAGFVVFGLVVITFSLWGLTDASSWQAILVTSLLAIWGAWLTTFSLTARLTMTSETLTSQKLWWHKQMSWHEIEKIEIDHNLNRITFKGKNKSLHFISPPNWSGPDKDTVIQIFNLQIEYLAITYCYSNQ